MPPESDSLTADSAAKFRDAVGLHQRGDLDAAKRLYAEVIAADPAHARALHMLGVIDGQRGDNRAAVRSIQKSIDADGGNGGVYSDLSRVLRAVGRYDEAIAAGQKAVELSPQLPEAANNLGAALEAHGRLAEAADAYERAIDLRPDYAVAWNNIGKVNHSRQRPADAAAAFVKALQIDPKFVQAYNNLGNVLKGQGHLSAAEAQFEKALATEPDNPDTLYRLATTYADQGRLDDGYQAFREALALRPDDSKAHSSLIFSMNYGTAFAPADIYAESQRWAQIHAPRAAQAWRGNDITPEPDRKLRIGYVSPDFRQHSVSHFFEPVLARHDRDRFEVFCYAEVINPDPVTERLRDLSDSWLSTVGYSDAAVAERVRADRIDILVDLAGHTGGGRLLTFAKRPAPVQISWLGYPNTTGLSAIDYRLTDAVADPEGDSDRVHAESLVRLPNCFLCFKSPKDAPEVTPLPAAENGHVTFGSFNNLSKITELVVEAWAQILERVPDSRLLLKTKAFGDDDVRRRYTQLFVERGVDRDRLTFTGWQAESRDHLSRYGDIDIALDTFPYNGTTTTCEALWMGVPVITLRGDRHAGRVGASILESVALQHFVAADSDAYVALAVAMADDLSRLGGLRTGLRQRLAGSPLCDDVGFTARLEDVYRSLWWQWCARRSSTQERRSEAGREQDNSVTPAADTGIQGDIMSMPVIYDTNGYAALWPAWPGMGAANGPAADWRFLTQPDLAGTSAAAAWWAPELAMHHDGPWLNWVGIYDGFGGRRSGQAALGTARRRQPDVYDRMISAAIKHRNDGELDEAEKIYQELLAQKPDNALARLYLGGIWLEQGKVDAAVEQMRAAAADLPDSAEAQFNLGVALKTHGDDSAALEAYERAIEIQPDFAQAHNNLGNIFRDRGQLRAAVVAYRQAVRVRPNHVTALNNLGNALRDLGQLDAALETFDKAVKSSPRTPQTFNNMGNVLRDIGRPQEAVDAFNRAIELRPNYPIALINLTMALRGLGRTTEAESAIRKAIELSPNEAEAYNTLGNTLKDLGRYAESVAAYRKALEIRPSYIRAHNNLLFMMNYTPSFSAADIYRESVHWNELHAMPRLERQRPPANVPDPGRPLRIGYVSPDFRRHSVSYFFEALARHHDRNAFSIICYAEVRRPDRITAHFQELVDGWRSTVGMSDADVAAQIRQDQIDILVDLAGHTARNRLLAFAERPAPIQVTWLGYPNTTGMTAVDYRMTDAVADPPGASEQHYTESLVRLPGGFLCFQPIEDTPDVSVPQSADSEIITFGSFNNLAKTTDDVVACWARLLRRVPGSRIYLKSRSLADTDNQARLYQMFETHGVTRDRVDLVAWFQDAAEHLGAYANIDIALDPFPYNGTTTTCEALWMGVPVVTRAGESHAGRVGASLLTQLGHPEWIAESEDGYLDVAAGLAARPANLRDLRQSLRQTMAASCLGQAKSFAEVVEAAYREMWRGWCAEEEVCAFQVTNQWIEVSRSITAALADVAAARAFAKSGKLDQAEARYESALARHPDNGPALVGAAVLAAQQGDPDGGLDLIKRAIVAVPGDPVAHYNQALMHNSRGDLEPAVACCRAALARDDEMASAHNLLGALLIQLERWQEAAFALGRAIELEPSRAEAHYNLGTAFLRNERVDEAIGAFRKAIELKSDYVDAYNNLGLALRARQDYADAIKIFEAAIKIDPDAAEVYENLGSVARSAGQLERAEAAFQRVIRLRPDSGAAKSDLALVFEDQGRLDEAIALHQETIDLDPNNPIWHNNLGIALRRSGRLAASIKAYEDALRCDPDSADAHNNLGVALSNDGRLGEAVAAFEKALELRPDFAEAVNNLGNTYGKQGKLDNAIKLWREILAVYPNLPMVHSNLIFCMNYGFDIKQDEILRESRAWNELHAGLDEPPAPPAETDRDPDRRLRIGYVSPDLRTHSVSYFFEPLLVAHDRRAFEVVCYAEVGRPDDVTERLRAWSDGWRSTVGLEHAQVADLIRRDEIDILVDLAGHSANNRLLAFAERPAPVLVSWLGYPNTTGMAAIGYRLTDAIADPPGESDSQFTESLIRLPSGFLCFRPPDDSPDVAPSPSIEAGYVTFGSFNTLSKVTAEVIAAWADLLMSVPNARLLLKARALSDPETSARVVSQFAAHGVSADRLALESQVPSLADHLATYSRIDIALDPFPYNGTTTTCEALWMGVPVITLCGDRHAARVGASLLTQVGLGEHVTESKSEYLARACKLAADPTYLTDLRAGLRGRLRASSLCDATGFAQAIEAAYRELWQDYCAA